MKTTRLTQPADSVEIPPFDFEHSRPNRFAEQYNKQAETVIVSTVQKTAVLLEPDVAAYFPDSTSVNAALRSLISAISTIKVPQISPSGLA